MQGLPDFCICQSTRTQPLVDIEVCSLIRIVVVSFCVQMSLGAHNKRNVRKEEHDTTNPFIEFQVFTHASHVTNFSLLILKLSNF